jgi:hypothetical protein
LRLEIDRETYIQIFITYYLVIVEILSYDKMGDLPAGIKDFIFASETKYSVERAGI